jgi:hypothetical protein
LSKRALFQTFPLFPRIFPKNTKNVLSYAFNYQKISNFHFYNLLFTSIAFLPNLFISNPPPKTSSFFFLSSIIFLFSLSFRLLYSSRKLLSLKISGVDNKPQYLSILSFSLYIKYPSLSLSVLSPRLNNQHSPTNATFSEKTSFIMFNFLCDY